MPVTPEDETRKAAAGSFAADLLNVFEALVAAEIRAFYGTRASTVAGSNSKGADDDDGRARDNK